MQHEEVTTPGRILCRTSSMLPNDATARNPTNSILWSGVLHFRPTAKHFNERQDLISQTCMRPSVATTLAQLSRCVLERPAGPSSSLDAGNKPRPRPNPVVLKLRRGRVAAPKGGYERAITGRARSDSGDEQAGVHTALSGARGEIRASQEAWPKVVGTLGHGRKRPLVAAWASRESTPDLRSASKALSGCP